MAQPTDDDIYMLDNLGDGANQAEENRGARKANVKGLLSDSRTRPKVLATASVLVIALIGSVIFLSKGSGESATEMANTSLARGGYQTDKKPSMGDQASPEYSRLEELDNKARAEEAKAAGGTHIELPMSTKTEKLPDSEVPVGQPVQVETAQIQPPPPVQYNVGNDQQAQAMYQKMLKQIENLSPSDKYVGPTITRVSYTDQVQGGVNAQAGQVGAGGSQVSLVNAGGTSAAQATAVDPSNILIRAGKAYYVTTDLEANSDLPGDIGITIHSGPLAGEKAICGFQTGKESLIIQCTTVGYKNSESLKIKAVLVQAETMSRGLATDVDNHYFERYGLILAASFVQGLGEAAARANTVVTASGLGSTSVMGQLNTSDQLLVAAGKSGQAVGAELSRRAQIPPTIKVKANTPAAIYFLEDVVLRKS